MTKTKTNKSKAQTKQAASPKIATKTKPPTRLDQLQGLLMRPDGASIAEMMDATGWQSHSVRGAMAGALKKRGLSIASDKVDGVRRYHASEAA
jgi:hypothetical protein